MRPHWVRLHLVRGPLWSVHVLRMRFLHLLRRHQALRVEALRLQVMSLQVKSLQVMSLQLLMRVQLHLVGVLRLPRAQVGLLSHNLLFHQAACRATRVRIRGWQLHLTQPQCRRDTAIGRLSRARRAGAARTIRGQSRKVEAVTGHTRLLPGIAAVRLVTGGAAQAGAEISRKAAGAAAAPARYVATPHAPRLAPAGRGGLALARRQRRQPHAHQPAAPDGQADRRACRCGRVGGDGAGAGGAARLKLGDERRVDVLHRLPRVRARVTLPLHQVLPAAGHAPDGPQRSNRILAWQQLRFTPSRAQPVAERDRDPDLVPRRAPALDQVADGARRQTERRPVYV
mmetsp:Transcript_37870/g.120445  ORF Transcript_37870/g.120445 Transcript_37870/m.120445 type:complete len:342 (+) Transcript_37870:634-1659(+)